MSLTNTFNSRMNVIATKDFGENIYPTTAGVIFSWWVWESKTSNSTLHLNDTLKFTSCFLVCYVFIFTTNLKVAEGETESRVAQIV